MNALQMEEPFAKAPAFFPHTFLHCCNCPSDKYITIFRRNSHNSGQKRIGACAYDLSGFRVCIPEGENHLIEVITSSPMLTLLQVTP